MKKTCQILCILLLSTVLVSLLTSCATLELKSDMKKEIYALFPDATISDIRESSSGLGLKEVEYVVQNHDISFTISNAQYKENQTPFNMTQVSVTNDYERRLAEYFDADIKRICEEYGITQSENSPNLVYRCHIEELDDVDRSIGAMQALLALFEPYLPTEAINQEDCTFDFKIELYSDSSGISPDPETRDAIYSETYKMSCARRDDLDFDEERDCIRFNIVDRVKAGTCATVCTPEQLSEYPTKTLTALNINGKPFTSERYPVEFIYDLPTDTYYATVEYGTSKDDFLQGEIIQSVYPYAEYSVDSLEDVTTYTIGDDRYKIIQYQKNNETRYEFWKNDNLLTIETKSILNNSDETNFAYGAFISIDDYADLMDMKLDSIENGVISLSVR